MGNGKTDLSSFRNTWYKPGGNAFTRACWYFVNATFFMSPAFPFSGLKLLMLRTFGARIGRGVVIKPSVSIKYPWNLTVGDHCWIGEKVWIDCLGKVVIGNNSCLSQGALILSGNHDFTRPGFDLMVKDIVLEEGVWIGAKAVVTQGVTCGSHSVLAVGSVASSDLLPYKIYRGNPAVEVKERVIS